MIQTPAKYLPHVPSTKRSPAADAVAGGWWRKADRNCTRPRELGRLPYGDAADMTGIRPPGPRAEQIRLSSFVWCLQVFALSRHHRLKVHVQRWPPVTKPDHLGSSWRRSIHDQHYRLQATIPLENVLRRETMCHKMLRGSICIGINDVNNPFSDLVRFPDRDPSPSCFLV
jgi:hypothetical protein